jgi:hypothetical protein
MPGQLAEMRRRLDAKPDDPMLVGGGSILLNRAAVAALVEIAEAAALYVRTGENVDRHVLRVALDKLDESS